MHGGSFSTLLLVPLYIFNQTYLVGVTCCDLVKKIGFGLKEHNRQRTRDQHAFCHGTAFMQAWRELNCFVGYGILSDMQTIFFLKVGTTALRLPPGNICDCSVVREQIKFV